MAPLSEKPRDTLSAFGHSHPQPQAVMPVVHEGFYEEVEHTADVAIRCGGPDLATLFRNAALGMYHLMGIAPLPGKADIGKTIVLKAMDVESLLVDWLGELAYVAETKGLIFVVMDFRAMSARRLEAVLTGHRVEGLKETIKAVTYHDLKVEKQEGGYTTTVVFDV
jgi:SHS2 domain-containing protein